MKSGRVDAIRARLESAFDTADVEVRDDSHLHAGHAGARGGRGHFSVRIVSSRFAGVPSVARHRQIYAALDELMRTDIHALSISALTPAEAGQRPPDPS